MDRIGVIAQNGMISDSRHAAIAEVGNSQAA